MVTQPNFNSHDDDFDSSKDAGIPGPSWQAYQDKLLRTYARVANLYLHGVRIDSPFLNPDNDSPFLSDLEALELAGFNQTEEGARRRCGTLRDIRGPLGEYLPGHIEPVTVDGDFFYPEIIPAYRGAYGPVVKKIAKRYISANALHHKSRHTNKRRICCGVTIAGLDRLDEIDS